MECANRLKWAVEHSENSGGTADLAGSEGPQLGESVVERVAGGDGADNDFEEVPKVGQHSHHCLCANRVLVKLCQTVSDYGQANGHDSGRNSQISM